MFNVGNPGGKCLSQTSVLFRLGQFISPHSGLSNGGSGGGLSSVDAFSERSDISSSSGERLPGGKDGLPKAGQSGGIPVISSVSLVSSQEKATFIHFL